MRIFLYEYITGGGLLAASPSGLPAESLLAEGRAMLAALIDDFLALPGSAPCTLHVLHDTRLSPELILTPAATTSQPRNPAHSLSVHQIDNAAAEMATFSRLAAECDFTVLIAPETQGQLHWRAQAVAAVGGKLLSPAPEFIALASNKHTTAERLAAAGVPVPVGRLLVAEEPLPADFVYPAVLKPVDGCGSHELQFIANSSVAIPQGPHTGPRRLERFCAGQAASMAVLCGPQYTYPLQMMSQTLTSDGRFGYLGGAYSFDENRENRARRLVKAALKALPPALGYIGFDLVLGAADDGRHDYIIEVNPRFTTSYIGQRQVFLTNLPHMLLEAAAGRWPNGRFSTRAKLEFTAAGQVTRP